jgi:hypothetical protein
MVPDEPVIVPASFLAKYRKVKRSISRLSARRTCLRGGIGIVLESALQRVPAQEHGRQAPEGFKLNELVVADRLGACGPTETQNARAVVEGWSKSILIGVRITHSHTALVFSAHTFAVQSLNQAQPRSRRIDVIAKMMVTNG